MNAMPEECLRIDQSRRPGHSRPVNTIPATQAVARATARNPIRGRLIMVAFVAVTPLAVGAWLWLLGRVAVALL